MRRTPLSAGRAAIYAAVAYEGAVVVTFFSAVQLLLNREYFALSAAQYGAVFVPVFAAAVLAALFAVWGSRSAARGRVLRLGLTLTAVGRAAMIPTVAVAVRHGGVFFPDLVIIGALTGAGFALVYSAATAFELDIDPARPERHLLRLALTLAAGMTAGPLLQIGFLEAGLWWALPLIAIVLAVLLITVTSRSRLGPDAARSWALRNPARRVPARARAYIPVALVAAGGAVICVAWSQAGMMGGETDSTSPRVFVLGAFWAALAVLASVAFLAIDLHAPFRRAASLGLFLLPAVVTVTGLATRRVETAVVGIFLLAAVVCAAFLPPMSQLTSRQLVLLPLVVGLGVIGIYPVAIALARPTLTGFRNSGAPLPVIFAVAGVVAIAAFLACARLIAFREERAAQGRTPGPASIRHPDPGRDATTVDPHLPPQKPPPPHARPSTAAGTPRQKPASHDNDDPPGLESEPPDT